MTHEELLARYDLRSRLDAGSVESWDAVQVETGERVFVHRLATPTRARLLEMMKYLDPAASAWIIERLDVDEIPVIVTQVLPSFTTFPEWLQKGVPATVTAPMKPLRRPGGAPRQPESQAIQPVEPAPEPAMPEAISPPKSDSLDLTSFFNPTDSRPVLPPVRLRGGPLERKNEISEATAQPASDGLTAMFLETGESPLLRKRPPSAPPPGPPVIAVPEIRDVDSAGEISAPPRRQAAPSSGVSRPRSRIEDESAAPSGPPTFREAFLATPDEVPSAPRPIRALPLPALGAVGGDRSLYDRVIDPRRAPPPSPPQPALAEASAQTRRPSVVPVIVAVGLLFIVLVSVFVVLAIRS